MKKHLKRLTALTVCLALLFSAVGVLPAHAAEHPFEPPANLFCVYNDSLQCSVLVLCWFSNLYEQAAYLEGSAVGETPDVTLEYTDADGTAKAICVEKDKIVQEVYTWKPFQYNAMGQAMPQLTVCLPVNADTLPQDTRVSVSAGAFRTADGEPLSAVSAVLSDFKAASFGLKGSTMVLPDADQSVEGQQMRLIPQASFPTVFPLEEIWSEHLVFTDNGEAVAGSFILQGAGTHTIRAALNPFLTAGFTVTTVTEKEAYRINTRYFGSRLGEATLAVLIGFAGLPLVFAPITGAAFLWMLGGGLGCYGDFFTSLFHIQVVMQSHAFRS